tara:strand:- start:2278 stop:2646 length:369 start_codon:yes stop_codon:yes gene_type:complete
METKKELFINYQETKYCLSEYMVKYLASHKDIENWLMPQIMLILKHDSDFKGLYRKSRKAVFKIDRLMNHPTFKMDVYVNIAGWDKLIYTHTFNHIKSFEENSLYLSLENDVFFAVSKIEEN